MTIRKRIKKAIKDYSEGDIENALIQAMIALDATAKKEGIRGGNADRCKNFISKNRDIITRTDFGLLEIQGQITFPYKDKNGKEGTKTFDEIIYHVIRCSLLHEGKIPETIIFTKKIHFGVDLSGKIILPERLVFGFIMSVIGSPANKNESLDVPLTFNLDNHQYSFNSLWGKRDLILKIFGEEAKDWSQKNSAA